jgi:hypothetical protein
VLLVKECLLSKFSFFCSAIVGNMVGAKCPAKCQQQMQKRCFAYKKIAVMNYAVMASLVAGCLAMIGPAIISVTSSGKE